MEKNLIERLEAVVTRLEANSIITGRGFPAGAESLASSETEALDPAILALDALVENSVMRFVSIGGKIGGSVGDLTKILQESFAVLRVLLIEAKRIKVKTKQLGENRGLRNNFVWFRCRNRRNQTFRSF